MKRALRNISLGIALAAFAFGGVAQAQNKPIKVGWTAWSDAEAVTKMAKQLIEKNYDTPVKLTLSDIAVQYQGVASGDLDMMLMAWLPKTHADYWKKFGPKVVDMGPIYTGAKLGWVVPDYIPKDKVSSIADLKKSDVANKLGDKIQGIDPGAGLMRLSKKAMKDYSLDNYNLVSASGAAMTAALARAIKRHEWIVVTGWTPHWMFAKYNLRYLKDPKGSLGGPEHIDAVVRKGFYEAHPKVAAFLARYYIPINELNGIMNEAQNTSYKKAIDDYIQNHQARVHYWLTGEIGNGQS